MLKLRNNLTLNVFTAKTAFILLYTFGFALRLKGGYPFALAAVPVVKLREDFNKLILVAACVLTGVIGIAVLCAGCRNGVSD